MEQWVAKKRGLLDGVTNKVSPQARLANVRASVWELYTKRIYPYGASSIRQSYYKGCGENSIAEYPILRLLFKEFFAEYGQFAVLHVSFGPHMTTPNSDGTNVSDRFRWTDKKLFKTRGRGFLFINEQHVVSMRTLANDTIVFRETQPTEYAEVLYRFLSDSKIFGDNKVMLDTETLHQVKGGCESMSMANILLPDDTYASNEDGNLMKVGYVERIYQKMKMIGGCESTIHDETWRHDILGIRGPWEDDSDSDDDDDSHCSDESDGDLDYRMETMRQSIIKDRLGRERFIRSTMATLPYDKNSDYRDMSFINIVMDIMCEMKLDYHKEYFFMRAMRFYRAKLDTDTGLVPSVDEDEADTYEPTTSNIAHSLWPYQPITTSSIAHSLWTLSYWGPEGQFGAGIHSQCRERMIDHYIETASEVPRVLKYDNERQVRDYQDRSFLNTVMDIISVKGLDVFDKDIFKKMMIRQRNRIDHESGIDTPSGREWSVPKGAEKYYETYYGKPFVPEYDSGSDDEDKYNRIHYRAAFVPENELYDSPLQHDIEWYENATFDFGSNRHSSHQYRSSRGR
ncbi:hypothetical protein T484DRAFT_1757296 [Baffinella frigidus]|nr:hypothetical protein T484DRAFT_1757296 [Cryptophyta sp. CCMP2293]